MVSIKVKINSWHTRSFLRSRSKIRTFLKLPNILAKLFAAQTKPVLSYFSTLMTLMILTRERKSLILEDVLKGLFEPEVNKAK